MYGVFSRLLKSGKLRIIRAGARDWRIRLFKVAAMCGRRLGIVVSIMMHSDRLGLSAQTWSSLLISVWVNLNSTRQSLTSVSPSKKSRIIIATATRQAQKTSVTKSGDIHILPLNASMKTSGRAGYSGIDTSAQFQRQSQGGSNLQFQNGTGCIPQAINHGRSCIAVKSPVCLMYPLIHLSF